MSNTGTKRKKRPLKDRVMIGISIAVCVISVLAVAFVLLYNSSIFSGENGNLLNNGLLGNNSLELDKETQEKLNSLQSENFLVCGLDESEQLTDVIMLVCFNYSDNTINVLQIPRDTYVESGAGSTKKINSAYNGGDSSLTPINRLVKVINEQFQLKVDHYATIDLAAFRDVVDAIGGVPIDIPYNIGNAQLGIIYKGQQTLNGEQSEWLVRHRHTYVDQDIGRIKIQRLFLASAAQQLKTIGLKEVLNIVSAVAGDFTTDLSVKDVQNYAKKVFSIDFSNMTFYVVPGEGTTTSNGQSVWTIHKYETADLLNKYFRPFTDDISADDLKITELAHTGEYYENTEDSVEGLISGDTPGKKKNDSSLPAYTHIVTAKPVVTTTNTVVTSVTAETLTSPVTDENGYYIDENGFRVSVGVKTTPATQVETDDQGNIVTIYNLDENGFVIRDDKPQEPVSSDTEYKENYPDTDESEDTE